MKKQTLQIRSIAFALFMGILVGSAINTLQATCTYAEELKVMELPVGNLLTWTTSSEKENELFLLQKSEDGETFTTVSIVRGAGDSEQELQYRYLDLSIGQERIFYRLMDVDKNDNFSYSKVVILQRRHMNNLLITNLENTKDQKAFRFNLKSAKEGDLDLRIFNEKEEELIKKQFTLVEGSNAISISASKLAPGTYRMLLSSNGETEEAFFIKDAVDKDSMRPVALRPKSKKNKN